MPMSYKPITISFQVYFTNIVSKSNRLNISGCRSIKVSHQYLLYKSNIFLISRNNHSQILFDYVISILDILNKVKEERKVMHVSLNPFKR